MQGRSGETVSVNAATGNLLISQQDEFLVGRGPDAAIHRTYNSLAEASDRDNGDHWQFSTTRRVFGLTGTLNTAGSTIRRQGGDGSVVTYSWNAVQSAYVATDGDGAHDRLVKSGATWVWTDGSSRVTETYEASVGDAAVFRLTALADTDGNALGYRYAAGTDKLDTVTTANHNNLNPATGTAEVSYVYYSWSGNNISKIVTGYTDYGSASTEADNVNKQLTRTLYAYDAQNRLIQVTVDLSPSDNSIADGKAYVTTYTYDGSSKRVASITQTDGSSLAIAYDASGRVTTLTQAVAAGDTRVTSLAYGANYTSITGADGQVTRLDYMGGSLVPQSTLEWDSDPIYVTKEAAGSIGGEVAGKFTSAVGAGWSGVPKGVGAVVAGDTLTYGISLQAVAGSATEQSLGLSGSATAWGTGGSTARIVSGPGQLVQHSGGFWKVTGLSTTEETRIEISRTFTQAETVTAHFYVDHPGGYRDGQQLIAGGAWVTKNSAPNGAFEQLTKITAPPAHAGAAAQVVQFGYDAAGNLTSITDTAGKVTTHSYDANGNLLTSADANGNVVTRTYGEKNQLLTETRTGSNAGSAAAPHTTRYVYDAENHLRFVISAEGHVVQNLYDAHGQLYWQVEFPNSRYELTGLAATQAPTETQMNAWMESVAGPGAPNRQSVVIRYSVLDARGNVVAVWQFPVAEDWAHSDASEGQQVDSLTYDQAGRLLSRSQAGQAAETFVYDGLGRLVASTDLAGGVTAIVFDDAALTTRVTLASGYSTIKTYNKAGDLVFVADTSNGSPSGTSSYAYDDNGRLRFVVDPFGFRSYLVYDAAGRKTAEIGHYGETVEYRYDAAGRVAATIRFYNHVSSAHLTQLADPDNTLTIASVRPDPSGAIWTWNLYDAGGRLVEEIDGDGRVIQYEYDQSDRPVSTRRFVGHLTAAQVAAFMTAAPTVPTYPAAQAGDVTTRQFYDRDGRLVGTLDGEGYLSEIVYDESGRKVEEIAFATKANSAYLAGGTFEALRATVSPESSANRHNRYVYDGQGFLRFAVDDAGFVTEYIYQAAGEWLAIGRVRSIVRHAAAIAATDFTYGNVKSLVAANAASTANRKSWSIYDLAGRLAYTVDADGAVTAFTYDVMGNVTKSVAFAVKRATTSLPAAATMNGWRDANIGEPANRVTRNWYTSRGELRYTVDGEGFVTERKYDAEGKMLETIKYDNAVSVADGAALSALAAAVSGDYDASRYQRIRVEYDAHDRVENEYDALGTRTFHWYRGNREYASVETAPGTPDASILSYRNFNQAGQTTWKSAAWGEAEQTQSFYSYDGLGNLISVTDPRGKITSYTYDRRGLLVTTTDAAGGVTTYEYNAFGEVVKTTDPRGSVTYTYYDELGRVAKVRDAEDYVTETTYNALGEVATVTRRYNKTSSAVSTTTPPTVTAHALDATTSFEYDKRGLVTKTTDAEGFFESYGYDAFGNRTSVTAKSKDGSKVAGGTTTYVYDRRGLLVSETLPIASYLNDGSVQSSSVTNSYAYDARGNRTQMIEAAGLIEARTTIYEYDKADQLTKTTGQAFLGMTPIEYLTYDARGNLTSRTDPAGARTVYFYDDLDRVVVTIDPVGTYSANVYDKNGNITSTTIYGTAVGVPADGGSEEEKPAAPGGVSRVTNFTYDNLNRLLTSSVAGVNSYITDGASHALFATTLHTVYEYDANGNVVKVTDANVKTSFNYYDKLGRKTATLDAAGYLTTWSYDAEGNVHIERRYATRFTGTPTTASPPNVPTSASDRVSQYGYDRNGNRTIELRFDVLVHDGAGGTTMLPYAAVYHSFNGLGQVVSKWEATSDRIDYYYDFGGRLTLESRAAYLDNNGNSVSPMVDYYYNGLDNLSRTRQRGAGDAAARITYYSYDGAKLRTVQDSAGFIRAYWYDIAGRETHNYYQRIGSNGSASTEYDGLLTSYDAAGRATQQWQANHVSGTGWVDSGPRTVTTYNAYGEATSVAVGGVTQQQNQYDGAGRLIATNSGDGLWKHFGYDGQGNQTIAITSAGASLAGLSFTAALALVGQENVNATYTQYDARGQAISVTEEQRRLSASTVQNLTLSRSYNAFGDVVSETNARGATTTYSYNNIGRMIRSEGPSVEITLENGAKQWVKPSQDFYYDASGRLVASRDANGSYAAGGTSGNGTSKAANSGNLTRLTLVAGTGYNGSEALVTQQIAADGGVKQTKYDVHGDARTLIDEIGRTTTQLFDGMGRVTQISHTGGLIDSYAYDGLGQRIKHWNNFLGSGEVETTDYDTQGRVIKTRAFGGDITNVAYSWSSTLVGNGTGTAAGGWTQVTTMANGRTATEQTDLFGRTVWKSDLGEHITYYVFDAAGRQISNSMGGLTASFTYYNTGQIATNSGPVGTATYGYDATGNRLSESLVNTVAIKSASATYDAMGRLKTWAEAGTTKAPAASTTHEYDANGNIRRTQSSFAYLDPSGSPYSYTAGSDSWYRYDSMNRLVTDKGQLSGAAGAAGTIIVRGYNNKNATSSGRDIVYDVAGQRVGVLTSLYEPGQWEFYHDPHTLPSPDDPGEYTYIPGVFRELRENYTYDGAGRLTEVRNAYGTMIQESYTPEGGGTETPSAPVPGAPATGGYLRGSFAYDLMGRLTLQQDYGVAGAGPAMFQGAIYSRSLTYNIKGQVTSDDVSTAKSRYGTIAWDIFRSVTTYGYGSGSGYALGSVVSQSATNSKFASGGSWSGQPGTTTTTAYAWYDGAVQDLVTHDYDTGSGSNPLYTTDLLLNGFGQMTGAVVADGVAKSVAYTLDETGQIVRRDESRTGNPSQAAPHEVYYRFGGRQMGMTGNNGTADLGYVQSTESRSAARPDPTTSTAGLFRNGMNTSPGSYADFATSYDPYSSDYQGSAGGMYTVRQGDTLQSIAANLWGDANLWYKLAEANGIGASNALIEGQTLVLPTGVSRSGHSASSIRPYDPTDAIGDLSPTTPKPPKKPKCGMLGMILVAAIAIGVALVTSGAFLAATNAVQGGIGAGIGAVLGTTGATVGAGSMIAAGAIGGAVGSIASQGFGVATGIQDKFSWKGVGLAAIAGGIGGAVGGNGLFGEKGLFGSGALAAAGRGAVGSAATQGIALATGLQSKFDFAGVAAAGVGAGIGNLVGGRLDGKLKSDFAENLLANTAGGIANAATRSAIRGNSFGDNLRAALPDIIGQTIGNAIGDAVSLRASSRADAKSFVEKAAELNGHARGTAGFEQFIQENKGITKELARDIADVQRSGNGDAAIAVRDKYAERLLGSDSVDYQRAQALLAPLHPTIVVRAGDPFAIHRLIDPIGVEAGSLAIRVADYGNQAIESIPGGRIAVGLLDLGLTVAGGPARAALGAVVGKANEQAVSYLTGKFDKAGYITPDAQAGGVGGPFLLTIATSGVGGALKLAGTLGAVRRINVAERTPTRFIDSVIVVDRRGGKTLEGTVDLGPTLDRIKSGGSYPHRNDGSIFQNRPPSGASSPLLPAKPQGFYKEYVVPTPGVNGPGPQRIVVGNDGKMYYTSDHYGSFVPIN